MHCIGMGRHLRNKLSSRGITKLTKPGVYSDGGGLYLRVRLTGTRSWVYIFTICGKRREMGLGSEFDVSLAEAREKAREARKLHKEGINPIAERQQAASIDRRVPTFGAFAGELIADLAKGFRNPKHRQQWRNTVEGYGAPLLEKRIDAIDSEHILGVLKPIWLEKPETARRLRGRLERILDAARVKGYREGENPARWRGHLELLLPKQIKAAQKHHAAMAVDELPAFMAKLEKQAGVAALALRWTILTAARTSETLGMTWAEIDAKKGLWTVPAGRMKANAAHEVPISSAARAILDNLALADRKEGIVFRGPRGGALSNMAMAKLLKRMGVDGVTVHGFRSTFRDWAGDHTDFARDDIEMCLAHTVKSKTERAYRRATALEKRRAIMRAWAAYCSGISGAPKVDG